MDEIQNMSQLAQSRNEKQLSRLAIIQEYSAWIGTTLKEPSSFVCPNILKKEVQYAMCTIQGELHVLLSESINHVMWLKGLGNDISADVLADMLDDVESATNTTIAQAHNQLSAFSNLQHR